MLHPLLKDIGRVSCRADQISSEADGDASSDSDFFGVIMKIKHVT